MRPIKTQPTGRLDQSSFDEADDSNFEVDSEAVDRPTLLFDGLADLQVNGFHGIDFADPELSVQQIDSLCHELARLGVTRFLSTLTTNRLESLKHSLRRQHDLTRQSRWLSGMAPGVHLEGPFLSAEDGPRGAHPKKFCIPADVEIFKRLQEAAAGRIRVLTLSPEYPTSVDLIRYAVAQGVIVSLGHTAATPEQIRAAVEAGATLSTHLGNGMHKQIPRHPNYLWEQIAADDLSAGLIADGAHLTPAILKTIVRAKTPARCFLVSDSTSLSGMPPGLYKNSALGDVEVTEDRRLVIAGQRLLQAGAYRPLVDALPIVMKFAEVDFMTALSMASRVPLGILQLPSLIDAPDGREVVAPTYALIQRNPDNSVTVKKTVINGQEIYRQV